MKKILHYSDYKSLQNLLEEKPVGGIVRIINRAYFFNQEIFLDSKPQLDALFGGRAVPIPCVSYIDPGIKTYRTFEEFSGTDEVGNLSTWLMGFIDLDSSLTKGKELEISQLKSPRDGRLDVVALSKQSNSLLVFEAKKNLVSLINERRFEFQIPEYKNELHRILSIQFGTVFRNTILLTIGGDETDMYPPDHLDCVGGTVGGLSVTFYNKILKSNIKFVSANALWFLYEYKKHKKEFNIFAFIERVFSDRDAIGLLTAGIVMSDYRIEPIILP